MKTSFQRNILLVLTAVLLFLLIRSCNGNDREINTLKQNVFSLNDSLRTYKDKTGQLVYEKGALISENGNLKNLNNDLANEVKNLKDNPLVVIKTVVKVIHDTTYVEINSTNPGKWNGNTFTQNFEWDLNNKYSLENYRLIEGNFDVYVDSAFKLSTSKMKIVKDEFSMGMSTGFTENKDGLLEIFVKSDYPGFKVSKLDGALIDPKKSDVLKKYFPPKRWAIGVYGGYGVSINPVTLIPATGIQIGVGLQYNILQWNFKK
jgi:cell division protein FtsB